MKEFLPSTLTLPPLPPHLDQVCDRFESVWKAALAGQPRPRLEEFLTGCAEPEHQILLIELLGLEVVYRGELGETLSAQECQQRFPGLPPEWLAQELTLRTTGAVVPLTVRETTDGSKQEAREKPAPGINVTGYEILGELGRGGMGIVFKAYDTKLKRIVALKMILGGSHAEPLQLQRFLAEAEAVAQIQHPNIVPIFEIGQHRGLPFFTLEYVAGGSLADKIKNAPLPTAQAARLLEQLAQAMAYAHNRGIVHRDLKPENVLLAADGSAKIADFGLAKRVTVGPGLTQSGDVLGTPSYMAPEQANGQAKSADPAVDVYSLGAILYRMLTGRPPFQAATAMETVLQVLHHEPVAPTQLQPGVPRDLETICLKCLHKEPGRRYGTALALAEDLQRFSAGEPILARPVGRLERLVKWARRRPAVAALSTCLCAAVLLLIGALAQALAAEQRQETLRLAAEEARDEKDRALQKEMQAKLAEAAAKTAAQQAQHQAEQRSAQIGKANEILTSVFRDLNPRLEEKGGPPLLTQLGKQLEQAAALLEGDAVGDPLAVARLQLQLGKAQLSLGYAPQAIALFTKARQTLEAALGPNQPETLTSICDLANAYLADGQVKKAVQLYQETLPKMQAHQEANHPDTLITMNNLAAAYRAEGQLKNALRLYEETLPKSQATLGPHNPHTLNTMHNLASAYYVDGQLKKALRLFEETLAQSKPTWPADHPDRLSILNSLALACKVDGQVKRAVRLYQETLEKRKAKLGPDHPDTLMSMAGLGLAYKADGQLKIALPWLEETLHRSKDKLGPDHPHTLTSMNNLASAYEADKQMWKAWVLYADALARSEAKPGPNHPDTLRIMSNLASAYRTAGQVKKAIPLFEKALARWKAAWGADHRETLSAMNNLAAAYWADGQLDKAVKLFEETLEKRKSILGADHRDTLLTLANLGVNYRDSGRLLESIALLEEAWNKARQHPGGVPAQLRWVAGILASTYESAKDLAKAETLYRGILNGAKKQFGDADPQIIAPLAQLGNNLLRQEKYTAAESLLRQCLDLRKAKQPEAWTTFDTQSLLGGSLLGQKKYADAEPLLLQGYEGMKQRGPKIPTANHARLVAALDRLIDLYEAWGKKDDAARWRAVREREPPSPSLRSAS